MRYTQDVMPVSIKATARRVIRHLNFTSPARDFRRNDSDVRLNSHKLSVTSDRYFSHPGDLMTQVKHKFTNCIPDDIL
jgi:hypothetical protein